VAAVRRRFLLIANPASRRGAHYREAALLAFRQAGTDVDFVLTERSGHAGEVATRLAANYEAVFTLGGDGTVMEVVDALANTGRPIGILPGGTGNLIARSLGIPLGVRRAVWTLLRGVLGRVDLGVLNGVRRFAFTAGIGIDARMIELSPLWLKRHVGVAAYWLGGWRAAARRELFHVRATVDGAVYEREASAVMVANFGAVLDDLFPFGPNIRHDDGLLDLCVFSPEGVAGMAALLWRLSRRDFHSGPQALYRSGTVFTIETEPPRAMQADGEICGTTPFHVTTEPLAASLLLPRRD
jgi:diacylglycerol kinase (ATP)